MNIQSLLPLLSSLTSDFSSSASASGSTKFLSSFQSYLDREMSHISTGPAPQNSSNSSLFLDPSMENSYFQKSAPASTASDAERSANASSSLKEESSYNQLIEKTASKYGVDPNLIYSVIKQESEFNEKARSHAGAMGLMQIMPGTARFLNVDDAYDPAQNIEGGTRYLKQMLDRYNGDESLALAAYNAGPGNVDRHNGIPPFKETQAYVPKVLNTYRSLT
ncbi:lytic transglycosylase domain-containing protein [Alteribacillus sp. HJP-4]|uniref:lytic transglycosylase domain-containing protein n=1 Tax=Alteribacillus sp. HJP-4 TaxID=2775394 RepID=UPI0035CD1B61